MDKKSRALLLIWVCALTGAATHATFLFVYGTIDDYQPGQPLLLLFGIIPALFFLCVAAAGWFFAFKFRREEPLLIWLPLGIFLLLGGNAGYQEYMAHPRRPIKELLVHGNYEAAAVACDELLERRPDDRWGLRTRAEVNSTLKRYDKAVEDFIRLIELSSSAPDEEAYMGRGEAYLRLDQIDTALDDFDRAIQISEGRAEPSARAYYLRGEAHVQAGSLGNGLRNLARSLAIEETYHAYRIRGTAYFEQRNFGEAEADWKRADELTSSREENDEIARLLRALRRAKSVQAPSAPEPQQP